MYQKRISTRAGIGDEVYVYSPLDPDDNSSRDKELFHCGEQRIVKEMEVCSTRNGTFVRYWIDKYAAPVPQFLVFGKDEGETMTEDDIRSLKDIDLFKKSYIMFKPEFFVGEEVWTTKRVIKEDLCADCKGTKYLFIGEDDDSVPCKTCNGIGTTSKNYGGPTKNPNTIQTPAKMTVDMVIMSIDGDQISYHYIMGDKGFSNIEGIFHTRFQAEQALK